MNAIDTQCAASLRSFKQVVRTYLIFHLLFALLITAEVIAFFTYLIISPRSLELGISLASFILTAFTYMVLLFYLQTKKPEQLLTVQESFLTSCSTTLPAQMSATEYHLFLAGAAHRLAMAVDAHTDVFETLPASWRLLLSKISELIHRQDVIAMKKHLLRTSIDHHLILLKHKPTDIEVHGSLANTYLAFASISNDDPSVVRRAIEEYRIIDHFSPNSPWVQAKLASCYKLIGEKDKERLCYEAILHLNPTDKDILFRLGILSFEEHNFAKGIEIYDRLRQMRYPKAEELIGFYEKVSETL